MPILFTIGKHNQVLYWGSKAVCFYNINWFVYDKINKCTQLYVQGEPTISCCMGGRVFFSPQFCDVVAEVVIINKMI
jgi:hypothetical protein